MDDPMRKFEAKALMQPKQDRADLTRVLLLSRDPAIDELAWAKEAARRYEELKAGRAESLPSSDVFQEARARLRRFGSHNTRLRGSY